MKSFCFLLLVLFSTTLHGAANTYSTSSGRLNVKNVTIDGIAYCNVALTLRANGSWSVDTASPGSDSNGAEYPFPSYDSADNSATFPSLEVDGALLQNVVLRLDPNGGWELSLARATPVTTAPGSGDFRGIWANDQKLLKYRLDLAGDALTLTNLRSGLVFTGTLSGNTATLVEDDAYLLQTATLILGGVSATLRIDSCQPKAAGYFCSRSIPVGTAVGLVKQP